MVIAVAGARTHRYISPELWATSVTCEGESWPVADDFKSEWYSRIWRRAEEPSVYETAVGHGPSQYRFTLIPSWGKPVTVRLERLPDGGLRLTAKRLSGEGGYDPGVVAQRLSRRLSPAEQADIEPLLASGGVFDVPPTDCRQGLDGSQWVFEAYADGRYRYLDRWSPKAGSPELKTGRALLHLTHWVLRTSPSSPVL